MPYSIMLDAGHGGRDPGAVYNGRQEKDDTLALTLAIGEILQNRGIDVEYTRTTDVYETPYQKAMEANEAGADFFISIHRNSYPTDNAVSGVESLVYDLSGIKLQMAENINSQLESVGFVNLGVKARPGWSSCAVQKCRPYLWRSDLLIQAPTTTCLTTISTTLLWQSRMQSWIHWALTRNPVFPLTRVHLPGDIPFRPELSETAHMQTAFRMNWSPRISLPPYPREADCTALL